MEAGGEGKREERGTTKRIKGGGGGIVKRMRGKKERKGEQQEWRTAKVQLKQQKRNRSEVII